MRSLLLLSPVRLTACASVTRGVHEKWTIESSPPGAKVVTTNGFSCDATPCSFKIERKAKFDVTVTKDGYKTWTGHVDHQLSGQGGAALVGNAVLGGLIGVGVDATTGAYNDLKPNPLKVTLEKTDGAPSGSR